MYLYDKLDAWREGKIIKPVPEYIAVNLNPNFELRPYQREAFENFITHFESDTCPKPTQVLFHMATGSGKTLIMAGLILYLYKRGYRNFLFFVNLTNILDKTRDNFLNRDSAKYLFADEIILDGERIRVNVAENFQQADADAINICFETTQGLHTTINFAKEGGMTFDDFTERKTVLISDEAHHLNVSTKADRENRRTWEQTVKHIFKRNAENILLEFTATCDLANQSIKAEYIDKIVFDYKLMKFYQDRYSKEIYTLRSDLADRWLRALVLSQYRLKIFQDHRLSIKPIILFKAAKIEDSKAFMKKFVDDVKNLRGERLRILSEQNEDEIIRRAFEYFAAKGISLEALAAELRDDFSTEHCISANDETDAAQNQILLNTLEDKNNPYRAVFEVKKLDEGWDVLNLFDIVRLYETHSTHKVTVAEAQLIGRGARYCPFKIDDDQPKFQRKYDTDAMNDLRLCETLYYHCQDDRRYISELHDALKEIGLEADKEIIRREYHLKESFKRDELYQSGLIFLNSREEISQNLRGLESEIKNRPYNFSRVIGKSGRDKLMIDDDGAEIKFHTTLTTIKRIAAKNFAIVHKALSKFPIYKFDKLKARFTNLKSTREFILDENFLGDVQIFIKSNESEPSLETFYAAVLNALSQIADELSKPVKTCKGTTDFHEQKISETFHDKVVNYSEVSEGGVGESQKEIDLAVEDWFAYNDNFGTSEEKNFVAYFKERVEELKKIYDKVYLVRNERELAIYSFDDGARFEPDYVLFLQKKNADGSEQWQIFIEPKGEHLIEHDAWKEKFLIQLREQAVPVKIFADDTDYKIWGLPFFNHNDVNKFDSAFGALLD